MPESTTTPAAATEVPQKLCEKCRHTFPPEQFVAELAGMECVCRRCLNVMGYGVKDGQ